MHTYREKILALLPAKYRANIRKFLMKRTRFGFTLIELLISISVVSIISGIIIVRLDIPSTFINTHDKKREGSARQIAIALVEYTLKEGMMHSTVDTVTKPICKVGVTAEIDPDCVSLDYLIPDYIACLPYEGVTQNTTGYSVYRIGSEPFVTSDHLGEKASLDTIGCQTGPSTVAVVTMGNGIIDGNEECDDGNTTSGDGCTSTGEIETGYVCSGEPSYCEASGGGTPTNPVVTGYVKHAQNGFDYLWEPRDVFVKGNYLYVASAWSKAMVIIDVSDKTNPTLASVRYNGDAYGTDSLFYANGIYVDGNYAYVVSGTDGANSAVAYYQSDALTIFDVTDPTNPQLVSVTRDEEGSFTLLDGANDVFVNNGYAYVTAKDDDSLTIINVSDPINPVWVSHVSTTEISTMDWPKSVYVDGSYAYVAGYNSDTLNIIDVSNPASPTLIGTLTSASQLNGPADVIVSGNYAYVPSQYSKSLSVIDISTKSAPALVTQIGDIAPYDKLDGAFGVAISGNTAFFAAANDNALTIIDMTDKENPVFKSAAVDNPSGPFTELAGASHLAVQGNYVYVMGRNDDAVTIISFQ